MSWNTITYRCPYLQREVTEIWDGLVPFIPVNAYLRAESELHQWEPETVKTKASRLLPFARWLSENGRSFWDDDVRLGGGAIVEFRNALFERVRPSDPLEHPSLTDATANRIMGEVLSLCRHWTGPREVIRGDQRRRRDDPRRSKRPAAFTVKTKHRSARGQESLRPDEIEAIWDYFFVTRRPPRRPPAGEPKGRWQIRTALWARECMAWALFMCTGLRRGEAPAIMFEDVEHYPDAGWWVHLVDPREHAVVTPQRQRVFDYGARLKSGSRDMIVWFEDRFETAFKQWVQWRPLLVARTGRPDHGTLLITGQGGTTGVGSPFTYNGSVQLFNKINEDLGPFRGDAGARPFHLSPHRVRHTLESYMKAEDVPLAVRQAVLGHRRVETTDLYGTVYRAELIRARNEFQQRIRGEPNV